jgi:hypothetical protein
MAGTIDPLTPKQQTAISCLLAQSSVAQAAQAAGVGERTLHRWLADAAFASAYQAARHEAVSHAIARVQQASSHAVTVLMLLMADKQVAPGIRLNAAKAVIEYSLRAVELEQIEARLSSLEAVMQERHR